jgi:hypothetical protein
MTTNLCEHHFSQRAGRCSCDICQEDFSSSKALHRHVQQFHHSADEERSETVSDRLTNEERREGEELNGRLRCDRCDLTFCSKNSLKTHVRIVHNSIRDFQCGVCELTFATVSGVKRHLVHHHSLGTVGFQYLVGILNY